MSEKIAATLVLQNGSRFEGYSFGSETSTSGEVVFNTSMFGYPEALTDPSNSGQILVLTYPLVGNYGVPGDEIQDGMLRFFESGKIHVKAVVVSDYSFTYSSWTAVKSLAEWLKENSIPGIYGVDTRQIAKVIRDNGSMSGKVLIKGDVDFYNPDIENQVVKVSCTEIAKYGNGEKQIVVVDCGAKNSLVRYLISKGYSVTKVPYNHDFSQMDYNGAIISTGPGDPKMCSDTVENIKKAFANGKPMLGIGLGHQLMAMAAGADIFKLKFGHHTTNQPVLTTGTDKAYVTAQNHSFVVDAKNISEGWIASFENLNDGSNEGLRHTAKPFTSVQFEPDMTGDTASTEIIYKNFFQTL